jgi:hypothetical protein
VGLIGALPRTAQTGSNEWSDVETNDARIRDEIDGNIDNANIKANAAILGSKLADASVPDAKLASPNNSTYKTIWSGSNLVAGGATTNTQYFAVAGTAVGASVVALTSGLRRYYFANADFPVGSLTQKLRLRAQLDVGASTDAVTLTFGLYPITAVSAGNYTIGTVTPGSTVAFASPSVNSLNQGNSGDFTIPSDGHYLLGVAVSASRTATYLASFQLQTRSV